MEEWPKRKGIREVSRLLANNEITKSERLLIWRRRRGLYSWQAAKIFRVTRKRFILWEEDKGDIPYVSLPSPLKDFEACYLLRRRSGIKQSQLARDLKLSRNWIHRMETNKEDCRRLVEYWEGVGVT